MRLGESHCGSPWRWLEEELGRGLLDDLTARTSRPLTAEERSREDTLLASLALLDKRLFDIGKLSEDVKELARQRDTLLAELTGFQVALVKKYGVSAGEVYDLARIQKHLAADTPLVAWVDMDGADKAKDPNGEHWGVVVRRTSLPVWVKLEPAREGKWEEKDKQLPHIALKVLLDPTTDVGPDLQVLYQQRLRPLEKHLDGVKHLVVLPSVAVAGIPIETLTDRYRISYAPSGTLYAWLREKKHDSQSGGDFLAFGDPAFSTAQDKIVSTKKDDLTTSLLRGENPRPLPGTRGEVETIARLFMNRKSYVVKLLGPEASGPNLKRLADSHNLSRFRFLHLATHGYADPLGGMNSYLALTPEDASSSHAKLSAGQIMRTWKLDADLVTLSACETALGEHRGGEGYVGFAQALFFAGARSLVLSQWKVDDLASTLLMYRFYDNLLRGPDKTSKMPCFLRFSGVLSGPLKSRANGERSTNASDRSSKVVALDEAKRWLKSLTRDEAVNRLKALGVSVSPDWIRSAGDHPFEHPFFWSAFILIGDPGPVQWAGSNAADSSP